MSIFTIIEHVNKMFTCKILEVGRKGKRAGVSTIIAISQTKNVKKATNVEKPQKKVS